MMIRICIGMKAAKEGRDYRTVSPRQEKPVPAGRLKHPQIQRLHLMMMRIARHLLDCLTPQNVRDVFLGSVEFVSKGNLALT